MTDAEHIQFLKDEMDSLNIEITKLKEQSLVLLEIILRQANDNTLGTFIPLGQENNNQSETKVIAAESVDSGKLGRIPWDIRKKKLEMLHRKVSTESKEGDHIMPDKGDQDNAC